MNLPELILEYRKLNRHQSDPKAAGSVDAALDDVRREIVEEVLRISAQIPDAQLKADGRQMDVESIFNNKEMPAFHEALTEGVDFKAADLVAYIENEPDSAEEWVQAYPISSVSIIVEMARLLARADLNEKPKSPSPVPIQRVALNRDYSAWNGVLPTGTMGLCVEGLQDGGTLISVKFEGVGVVEIEPDWVDVVHPEKLDYRAARGILAQPDSSNDAPEWVGCALCGHPLLANGKCWYCDECAKDGNCEDEPDLEESVLDDGWDYNGEEFYPPEDDWHYLR